MKTRFVPTAGAALLWLAVAVAPAVPQDPETEAGRFTERIDVELVNVDVWVTGPQGDPVTGLAAGDFEILHDGQKVPITHFTEVRSGAEHRQPAAERAGGEAPPAGRSRAGEPTAFYPGHVVVYFDQSRLHPRNYPALVQSLEDFLTAEGVEPERVLVLRQERSLFVEAPFGSSRRELKGTLERLAKGAPSGIDLETETEQALQAIRATWEQSQDSLASIATSMAGAPDTGNLPGSAGGSGGSPRSVVGGFGSMAGPDACGPFSSMVQSTLNSFARVRAQRVAVTLANLSDSVRFLAGLPGVKSLLYLSDGLATQPGTALASYASNLCPAAGAELLSGASFEQMNTSFLELTRHANTNRVTIYSLQATGLSSPGVGQAKAGRNVRGRSIRSRGAFESSQRINEREGLGLIARETGGRAIFNQNDLAPELARIGQDLGTYYSLAYQPPAGDDRGAGKRLREHRIEVRLGDGSLAARYRRGYLEKDDSQRLTERIEGALNLGITSNPLEVRLGAGAVGPGAEGTFRLPLHVMVPVERLAFLPQGESLIAEVTLRVMARSLESSALALRDKSFRVEGSPGAAGLADLVIDLELAEGVHVTAVGVRDEASREASFVSTTLQVGPGG